MVELIEFFRTVYQILRTVVTLIAREQAITLIPDDQVVTTQRAADNLQW